MKAFFYMEEMADLDLEDAGDDNASERESARINRIELACEFNRVRFETRKKSIADSCAKYFL